jgi:hypothetical protein
MRCIACNRNLNDYESTAKSASTGEYLDTCRKCLSGLDIKIQKNMYNPNEDAPNDVDLLDVYGFDYDQFNTDEEDENS